MKALTLFAAFAAIGSALGVAACGGPSESAKPQAGQAALRAQLTPMEFNALAARLNMPLYWTADTNGNTSVDENEVVPLMFYPGKPPDLNTAYRELLAAKSESRLDETTADGKRRALVRQELAQG